MNFRFRSLFFPAVLLGVAAVHAVAAEKLKVVMVTAGTIDMPLVYAMKEGCLAERGLSVERLKVTSGATAVLAANEADLQISALGPVLAACKNGAGIRVVALLPPMLDTVAISRYPRGEVSKVRTIALSSPGVGGRGILQPFLSGLGLDPSSLKYVIGKGDDVRFTMLKMGYADFFVTHSQELARKVAQEGEYFLVQDPSEGRGLDARVVTAGTRALRKRGPAVGNFVAAMRCAVDSAAANPEKTASLMMEEYGYTREEALSYAARFTASVKGYDLAPEAAVAAGSWRFVDGATDEDRASTSKFLFPDYARLAGKK